MTTERQDGPDDEDDVDSSMSSSTVVRRAHRPLDSFDEYRQRDSIDGRVNCSFDEHIVDEIYSTFDGRVDCSVDEHITHENVQCRQPDPFDEARSTSPVRQAPFDEHILVVGASSARQQLVGPAHLHNHLALARRHVN